MPETSSPKTEEQKYSKLRTLFRSPLASRLLLLFALLPLTEAIFIGSLCHDIKDIEQIAGQEFHKVKVLQDFSAVLDSLRSLNDISLNYQTHDCDPHYRQVYYEFERQFLRRSRVLKGELAPLLSQRQDLLTRIDTLFSKMHSSARDVVEAAPQQVDHFQSERYRIFRNSYTDFEKSMEIVRADIDSMNKAQPILGLQPLSLLYLAALANLLCVVALVLFVEFRVTRPIGRLARDCGKIKYGEIIEMQEKAPVNEISALRQTFFQMSCRIREAQNRRKSYLELLKAAQTTALLRVNEWLATALNYESCGEQAKRRLERSRSNITRLMQILGSMTAALDSENGPSRTTALQRSKVKIADLFEDTATAMESLLDQKEQKLLLDSSDIEIYVDRILLSRVLLNLASNAAKFSPEQAQIKLSAETDGASVRIRVCDPGPGIDEGDLDKLFKKFSQISPLDGVKRPGTGLGLLVCKEIVEAHGGTIGCLSEAGKGSTFWFTLPVQQAGQLEQAGELEQVDQVRQEKQAGLRRGAAARDWIRDSQTKKKAGSLKTQFGTMLAIFILVQIVLFLDLRNTFMQQARSANQFAEERSIALATDAMYARFLVCGRAFLQSDFETAGPLVTECRRRIDEIVKRTPADNPAYGEFIKEQKRAHYIARVVDDSRQDLQSLLNPTSLSGLRKTTKLMKETEDGIYRIFALQRASFKAVYQGGRELTAKLWYLLMIAAVADLAVITAAAIMAMHIVQRISALQGKAEDFASGKALQPTLSGNDELSLLDSNLCLASAAIRDAESQRQELMAAINHDLRTPLSSVLSSLQMVNQGVYGQLQQEAAEVLKMSERELQRLLAQVNDLLLLEKIDSGSLEPAKDRLCFKAIIEQSLASVCGALKEKAVELSIDKQDAVEDAQVEGDRELLVRLCNIVLTNAIAASRPHGQIKLWMQEKEGAFIVKVEDQGPGIAAELQNQIFERFRFLNGKPLTGLGLPLAYRLCSIHGGSIDLKTQTRQGSAVEIKLPICPASR